MTGRQDFENLISAQPEATAPLITIYSNRPSSRLQFACEFIFNRVLKVNFLIETERAKFELRKGIGINYSEEQVPADLQIIPDKLIFQTGISELKPGPFVQDNLIYFFETKGSRDFSFDIFSAVFYFLSRYEEYQHFKKDAHGRFEVNESILFKNNFYLKPVVDYWILDLEKALFRVLPELKLPERKMRIVSTMDIDNLFAYRYKGLLRTVGASLKDVLKIDIKNLKMRVAVLSGKTKDPFDVYEKVSTFCEELSIPFCCFFLFKSNTKHDRTVNPKSVAFNKVFDILKQHKAEFGLHPSYNAAFTPGMLAQELHDFKTKSNRQVDYSRQHYLRFDIRTTPDLLLKNGIKADFTMGFASSPGFRAGTSYPFHFYDFDKEHTTELILFPFCAMDGAFFVYTKTSPSEAFKSLLQIAMEVKNAKGIFTTVFHERTFSDHLYPGFGTLYKNLHLKLKEL